MHNCPLKTEWTKFIMKTALTYCLFRSLQKKMHMQERGSTFESSNLTSSDRLSHVFIQLPSRLPFSRLPTRLPLRCLFFSHRFLPSLPFITSIPYWKKKKNPAVGARSCKIKWDLISNFNWFAPAVMVSANGRAQQAEYRTQILSARQIDGTGLIWANVCSLSTKWMMFFFLRISPVIRWSFFFSSPGKFSASPLRTLASWPFFKLSPSVFLVYFEKVHLLPYLCLGLNCAFFFFFFCQDGIFFSPAYH